MKKWTREIIAIIIILCLAVLLSLPSFLKELNAQKHSNTENKIESTNSVP